MLTSAHGIYKGKRGFTLIEMMLVILVVGISLAIVVPNFNKNNDQVLDEEGHRLVALLHYATEFATSTGRAVAWDQTSAGYRFLERDQDLNVWKPLMDDVTLRERNLPDSVRIDGVTSQSPQVGHSAKVIINPSGVQATFEIGLHNDSKHIKVAGNLIGQITMRQAEN
jgi:general secretion pathway protein H